MSVDCEGDRMCIMCITKILKSIYSFNVLKCVINAQLPPERDERLKTFFVDMSGACWRMGTIHDVCPLVKT